MSLIIESTPLVGASRWVATESPILFGLQRNDLSDQQIVRDEYITSSEDSGGFLKLIITWHEEDFLFYEGDSVSVHDATTDTMLTGTITTVGEDASLILSIPWVAGTDIDYLNDNTTKPNYYFEVRLTINETLNALTVIASPNSFGYAEIDVSGVLQTVLTAGKVGAETGAIVAETNKSGWFTVEVRECWYYSSESYTEEGNTWNYAEFVRSAEQGGNLEEYVPDYVDESPAGTFNYDNPICNLFTRPVITEDLPFSLSYLQGMAEAGSPAVVETVTYYVRQYNSLNVLIDTLSNTISVTDVEMGRLCSCNIDTSILLPNCAYITFELLSKQVE